MYGKHYFLLYLFTISVIRAQNLSKYCPKMLRKVFKGYIPKGNTSAGTYTEIKDLNSINHCVFECCDKEDCNVAFMAGNKCYHISCSSNELCIPFRSPSAIDSSDLNMVLVKPVLSSLTWEEILTEILDEGGEGRELHKFRELYGNDAYADLLQMDETTLEYNACTVGINTLCTINEECVPNNAKSRAGTCHCKLGYVRGREGICTQVSLGTQEMSGSSPDMANTTESVTKKQLTVVAESKEVKLPENEVTLKAVVTPSAAEGEKYQYAWTSLKQPNEGSGAAVKKQNGDELQLSNLSEGLYIFKVNVSSETAYGETFVNVTVLPPSRINRPPQIVITPANQVIKLPNTGAVLDASSSTDDDGIVSFHWELQQAPVGYQPQLTDKPTLQLNDLSRPGNYTFKLTVTDTDKAMNTSVANVTVLKITDYPPEANAGQDTIIYLPHNKITLNGNLSTDDHNITTWEWTKSSDDADKAVDMQDTRTPYLRLSDLEEGVYTFVLKVTDSANQSSTAMVHVFVKPPTNQPPVARTGANITISLPQTWAVVDGSNSTDDNKIVAYKWEQMEGPSAAQFVNATLPSTNVTGLTKGNYALKLSVTDDNKNTASAIQYVIVNQNKNQKPKADAGEDLVVELPRNAVYLNGSKSSDDWAIKKWKWTRCDESLAVGNVAEGSDDSSVLILTDLMPGKYVFNLTVWDEQGLTDTDTVQVVVKQNPKLLFLVDMIVYADAKNMSAFQYNLLKGKLSMLVQDNTQLKDLTLRSQDGTDNPVISFYVETRDGHPLQANDVVRHLREKLVVDASLLGFSVKKLRTVVCQNNCSGHGYCDEKTRECICEAFWMKDLFKAYFGNDDPDCSWSILYVVLGVTCAFIGVMGSIWGSIYLCLNRCSCKPSKPTTTYKLIEDHDDIPSYNPRKADLSDSDTDSDVVFESRNKTASTRYNGASDMRNGHKPLRNGYSKMGRRVKT